MRFIDRLHYLIRTLKLDPAILSSFLFTSRVKNHCRLIHINCWVIPSILQWRLLLACSIYCILNFFRTFDELLHEQLWAIWLILLHLWLLLAIVCFCRSHSSISESGLNRDALFRLTPRLLQIFFRYQSTILKGSILRKQNGGPGSLSCFLLWQLLAQVLSLIGSKI